MTKRIDTLEASRGLAALAVVVFHINATYMFHGIPMNPLIAPLVHGVDFFFLISGFIIYNIHEKDIGCRWVALDFLKKRFIRLFPTLWLVSGTWIVIRLLMHKHDSLNAIGTSLFLYPSMDKPVPDVIWTLRHELLFYSVFLILILNRTIGTSLFALWTFMVLFQLYLVYEGHPLTGIASFFLSTYEIPFVIGIGIAKLLPTLNNLSIRNKRDIFITGVYTTIISLVGGALMHQYRVSLSDYTSEAATLWVLIVAIGFTYLLLGTVLINDSIVVPKWLILLGSSSYALYLVHVPIQDTLMLLNGYLPTIVVMILMLVVPITMAYVLHIWFEKPMSRWLKKFNLV